jgi:phosphoglycerate dehydrogenase-like enzyme/predicted dehydrogenase
MSTAASTTRPLRVGVIGAGPAAQAMHLPALARLQGQGRLELALVCDIDSRRAAAAQRRYRFVEASADAGAAVERNDLQVVYIFGSAQLHHRLGLGALRSGKHLFVEKPIAPGYADAISLAQAARAAGMVAVGGHNRRFYASLAAVRAHAGKAGWRCAEAVFHKAEFGRPPLFGARTWLGANGIHALDVLLYMMGGPPEQLWSLATEAAAAVPGTFSALMRWRGGAQGIFLCNNNSGSRREEYVFHGLGETHRVSAAGVTREHESGAFTSRHAWIGDGIEAEHCAFLDAIHGRYEPVHSIGAIAPSLFVAELIEAGFCGEVRLPSDMPYAHPAPPATKSVGAPSIVMAPSPELVAAVSHLLPDARMTSIEEIERNDAPRPDVAAVILGRGSAAISAVLLDRLPNLAVVGIVGLSLAHHRPRALLEKGITVLNASAAYADSVAEMTLGLMTLGRRHAFESHEALRAGAWGTDGRKPGFRAAMRRGARLLRPITHAIGLEPLAGRVWRLTLRPRNPLAARAMISRELRGAIVALIGWGANAHALTRRLLESRATVVVYSEHAAASEILAAGAAPVSLHEALAAEVVSLHRGLTPRTRHFLGAAELDKLRAGTLLVNVARGALIEPGALLARLRRGDIFACLDTFDEEPLAPAHPLRGLPNVFLTAHIAAGSDDMHARAIQEVVGKVASYLKGVQIETVSMERLANMT